MSDEHIVRRTLRNRQRGQTDWGAVDSLSEAEVERGAASDADNPSWTEAELAAAQLVLPGDHAKVPVSIRLDREVIDYFKEEGRGYQSRINAVLLGYVRARRRERRARG